MHLCIMAKSVYIYWPTDVHKALPLVTDHHNALQLTTIQLGKEG